MGTELAKEELQDQYMSMTDTVQEMQLLVEQMKQKMVLLFNCSLDTLPIRIENVKEDLEELEPRLNTLSQGLVVWEKLRELITNQYPYAELRKIYDRAVEEIVDKR